jgi:hypothetical protein
MPNEQESMMSEQHLSPNTSNLPIWGRIKAAVVGVATLIVFIVFGFWSGVPRGERALAFWIGVELLLVILIAFSWAAWHLLFRLLPAGQTVRAPPVKASYGQALALLLGVGGAGLIVGAFWDEIWHRQYSTPFGEDFFGGHIC